MLGGRASAMVAGWVRRAIRRSATRCPDSSHPPRYPSISTRAVLTEAPWACTDSCAHSMFLSAARAAGVPPFDLIPENHGKQRRSAERLFRRNLLGLVALRATVAGKAGAALGCDGLVEADCIGGAKYLTGSRHGLPQREGNPAAIGTDGAGRAGPPGNWGFTPPRGKRLRIYDLHPMQTQDSL